MKKQILAAVLIIGVVVGCKKDDGDSKQTAAELITSSSWKIDTAGLDMDRNGEIDASLPDNIGSCQKDNTITFSSDSTGVLDEGATKCDITDPQTSPFVWSLRENDKIINIQGNVPEEMEGDINILSLSSTNFVLSKSFVTTLPIPASFNVIMKLKK